MPDIDAMTRGSLQTAIKLSEEGKFPEAIQALEMGLSENPDNPLLLGGLGNIYAQMEDWRKSLYYYLSSVQHDPKEEDSLYSQIGLAYHNLGEYNSAIIELENGLVTDPDNSEGHWLLARSYHKAGRLKAAFKEYEILLNIYRGEMLAITHFMIADLYHRKNQLEDAIIELQKGIEINPNIAEAHNWLGKCYEQKGLLDEAKSEYEIAKNLGYTESDLAGEVG
jgi:tetratricopeptide (TPR) repeat protein